jgi:hypothetical protein
METILDWEKDEHHEDPIRYIEIADYNMDRQEEQNNYEQNAD